MSSRANMIKARGLVTFGSELSVAEGSQRQATNVNIDEDGVITPRRGLNDFAGPTTGVESSSAIVNQIMEYKDVIIRQYQDEALEYEDSNGDFQAVNGTYNILRDGYRTKWQEANSNFYFTSDTGIKKISVKNQAGLNADMVTNAGGIKAGYVSGVIVPTVGGFLPPESKVGYRILFGTKDNNNNLIDGSPSSRSVVTNYNTAENISETSFVDIADNSVVVNGDHFIYTNSTGKYVIYLEESGTAPEPATSETIGGIYIKATTGVLSNSSAAAVVANAMSAIPNVEVSIDAITSSQVNITSTEEGDITGMSITAYNATGATLASTTIETNTTNEGETSEGISATVKITGVVPNAATTNYFYQVYRTSTISVSTGLTINDLDPGDEMNLVYESGLIDSEILAGEFEFVDTTPESFRAEAAPLYTNEVTGEGILQSNEAPPIALDIELFRNHMFYANTKEKHRLDFTIVSVDDFITDSTRMVIGNSDITRYYTFVGTTQIQDIEIDSLPTAGDYINVFSANDERQYYIYFGLSTDDPEVAGAVGYRIDISDTPTTDTVAARISSALSDNVDFNLTVLASNVEFNYTNNGYTTGITNGVGSDITITAASVAGTGETSGTDEGGDALLSGLISVGQSIDETARSLVKVISQDSSSPVNAYYLSTGEDLPGNILIEARSLEDKTFYVAIEESGNPAIGGEFTPELPYSQPVEEITANATTTTIDLAGHTFVDGDQVFVGYFEDMPADPDSFSGLYTIENVVATVSFDIPIVATGNIVTPAFSAIFSADVESDNKELPNRIYYSKSNQPEAVPVENFIDIGTQDGEIKRILALRDNLFVLKDDGIYVVSGTSAPDWSTRLIDSTRIIAADSAVVLNNQIYCLTEQGVTRITGSGAAIISRGIENKIDLITNQGFDYSSNTFGIAYENDRAYIMFVPTDSTDTSATQAFRYNMFEQTWSRWEYDATCGHVLSRNNKLYVGNADRNYISEERKNNDRTDFCDRDFEGTINTNGVNGTILELSTLTNIKVNDVIVQEQEVSINYINNRILKKMDYFDTGTPLGVAGGTLDYYTTARVRFNTPYPHRLLNGSTWSITITDSNLITTTADYKITVEDDNNVTFAYDSAVNGVITFYKFNNYYFNVFKAVNGDNIPDIMQEINEHMFALDPANITARTYTQSNLRANTEALIDEFNTTATITSRKTYKKPSTVQFEAYIDSTDVVRNQVEVHTERPFVEGVMSVFKGYTCTVEWNPQHFGDPSALKQVRYATIMFDQNNFNIATAKFASDLAQSTVSVPFKGKGIAYWGDLPFDNPNSYWGGEGNDVPFRNPVPRGKQRCRYLSMTFEHKNAREYFRILGISGVVRAISDRGYR